jgi:hypothetical protein
MENSYTVYDTARVMIEKLDIGTGDVIAVTLPADTHPAQAQAFSEQFSEILPPGVQALILTQGTTVEVISEQMMNKMGWFRFNPERMN